MDAQQALTQLGGIADSRALRRMVTHRKIKNAVRAGEITRLSRGRYTLPVVDEAWQAAARVNGVVSHLSAAMLWGLKVKSPPALPTVTVPRGRKLSPQRGAGVDVHYAGVAAEEASARITSVPRTVIDCARALPFDAALAVADSALRQGKVTRTQLLAAAEASPRSGRSKAVRVAREADRRAANPFESVLRAIALDRGVRLEPQLRCHEFICADLGSNDLRLALEAESWAYHGDRQPFDNDVRRYTTLTLERWIVLRFLWNDVMHRQQEVGDIIVAVAEWCAEIRQFERRAS
ncbi:very-short-patch-repair endonuclease [Nocardioides daedukensis]|uniref:Very-short-patch-repair endonuclease n=1 Tax=Nocardioides daedukensis TaxID=634462 RepID=A0A7Y9S4A2_9ACTN|nr:hypothetical protein [Nocardioides daedukensis]NYG59828.1 very-short-patch-repair endonuclease [Nocardioides daedukensis]